MCVCVCVCVCVGGCARACVIWKRFINQFPVAIFPSTAMYGPIIDAQNVSVVALLLCHVNKSVCHSLVVGSVCVSLGTTHIPQVL